jgi:hypothetical protein
LCKKLLELPNVTSEWQQALWCPDCDYYGTGSCSNPVRHDGNASCPFDGKPLPLREAPVDELANAPRQCPASSPGQDSLPSGTALEQTIYRQIKHGTSGRVQALKVAIAGPKLVIGGIAPSYHVKQLALKGALDIVGSTRDSELKLCLDVAVCPQRSGAQ